VIVRNDRERPSGWQKGGRKKMPSFGPSRQRRAAPVQEQPIDLILSLLILMIKGKGPARPKIRRD